LQDNPSILDLLQFSTDELARRKTALEVAKLATEAEGKRKEGWLEKRAPILTPIAAFTGIILSIGTILSLIWNAAESRSEAEQKYFSDLVQSASKKENGPGQRIAGILLLGQYWGNERYDAVLANTLSGMLANEEDEGVLDACAEAIGDAYTHKSDINRQRIRRILFGTAKPEVFVGALLRSERIVIAANKASPSPNDKLYKLRIHYFGEAVRLNWKDLEDVYFFQADLSGVQLYKAHLKGSILRGANLSGPGTTLYSADLEGAELSEANLSNVDAHGANFAKAQMLRTKFDYADLSGANLKDAQLEEASLVRVNLSNANLQGAQLQGADMIDANLAGANLQDANLEGAEHISATELKKAKGKWTGTIINE